MRLPKPDIETVRREALRDQLWGSLRVDGFRPDSAIDTLLTIVVTGTWRELGFTEFRDFIYGKPPEGIGLTPERLELLFAHPEATSKPERVEMVAEVRRLLDLPLGEHGGDRSGGEDEKQVDNINLQGGTGEDYTRRRLRRDRPDLYERVIEGELSANAAAIEAGFRRRTATIPVDSPESAFRALERVLAKHFTAEEIVVALEGAIDQAKGGDRS